MSENNLRIEYFDFNSVEYLEALAIRDRILRMPLGLTFTHEELERDKQMTHFVAFKEGRMVGTAQGLKEAHRVRIRQVAVEPKLQRQGIGRALILAVEEHFRGQGVLEAYMHAREENLGFYTELNYELKGDRFFEIGLPHRLVQKKL